LSQGQIKIGEKNLNEQDFTNFEITLLYFIKKIKKILYLIFNSLVINIIWVKKWEYNKLKSVTKK